MRGCVVSPQAQVLYDFTAEAGNNELTVREGETVTITNQVGHVSVMFLSHSLSLHSLAFFLHVSLL